MRRIFATAIIKHPGQHWFRKPDRGGSSRSCQLRDFQPPADLPVEVDGEEAEPVASEERGADSSRALPKSAVRFLAVVNEKKESRKTIVLKEISCNKTKVTCIFFNRRLMMKDAKRTFASR